jgi:NADH dehydrogenase
MIETRDFDVVTGAFGYTGKYVTRRLLAAGRKVRTLTNHPDRPNPFNGQIEIAPMDFRDPSGLVESLRGARTLFNSYWVRFSHGQVTFDQAVANSKILIQAAKEAGVRRIVHTSIANPSIDSPFPYYAGKAQVEKAIIDSGLSHAILRPIVIFGPEDVLINNIAWFVRHLPFFAIPGDGRYQMRPIFVEDMAELAVRAAQQESNLICDAVGPESFAFEELVRLIASTVGRKTKLFHAGPTLTLYLLRLLEPLLGDVILTREEIDSLMANLLASKQPPTGQTRLSDWLAKNRSTVGTKYASELRRHFRRN